LGFAFTPDSSVDRPRGSTGRRRTRQMFDAAYPQGMAAPSTSESTPQRLAAIRAQMSLLSDYL
jgi:hypothetical protein